jgi:hypothetical protein
VNVTGTKPDMLRAAKAFRLQKSEPEGQCQMPNGECWKSNRLGIKHSAFVIRH